jgi:DNA-binding transcriptional LysR family regulator
MDKWAAMRTFRRVVELGSFTAAAQDLKLAGASVSKHVAELERDLGTAMIARTTRRISLTEPGRLFFLSCQRLLDDLTETEHAVKAAGTELRGTLRVNAPMSFGVLHLTDAVKELLRIHPDLHVDLSMNDRTVDLIEGSFDVAVRIRTELPDSSLIVRRIAPVRRVLCAAPEYLATYGDPTTPEELAQHRCLVYSLARSPERWPLQASSGRDATVEVMPWLSANSSLVLKELVLAGLGIAAMPTFVVWQELLQGAVVRVLEGYQVPSHSLYAVYPPNRTPPAKVRAFVDLLAARFSPEPPWDIALNEGRIATAPE